MAQQSESKDLLFLSRLLKQRVQAPGGRHYRIVECVADFSELYPVVRYMVVAGSHKTRFYVPWSKLIPTNGKYVLNESIEHCSPQYSPGARELMLKEAFLDRQIVDTNGAKIRRVNDLQLLSAKGSLYMVHVDVGFRGLMRRVGLQSVVDFIARAIFDYELKNSFISWRYVQPIASPDLVRLTIDNEKLARMHPADLADIIEDLDVYLRDVVFQSLDVETAADALEETDPKIQLSLIESLDTEAASDILEEMSQSEAADLLGDLPEEWAEEIMQEMEADVAEDMKELLEHVDDVSGGLMTTSFLSMRPDDTVAMAFDLVRQEAEEIDFIYYIYVINEKEHLLGVVSLRELFVAIPRRALHRSCRNAW